MSGFLGILSFGNFAAFGLLIAAPLLLIPYLRRRYSKPLIVSSVLILKTLPKRVVIRKRIKPPLRFYLELLTLILLALSLAMPALRNFGKPTAIVIDNSMSMAAVNLSGDSRFQQLKRSLRDEIKNNFLSSNYALYSASPKLSKIDESLSATELLDRVNSLKPTSAGESLDSELPSLLGSEEFGKVIVFTDRLEPLENNSIFSTPLRVISVSSPLSNIFVSQFSLETSPEPNPGYRLEATVASSSNKDIQANVSLEGFEWVDESRGNNETPLAKKTLTIGAQKAVPVSFLLPKDTGGLNVFRVRITSDEPAANSLAVDDEAWTSLTTRSDVSVLLVSPDVTGGSSLGLSRVPLFSVNALTPEAYNRLTDDEKNSFSLFIFHKSSPTIVPNKSALFILPPANNPLFSVINPEVKSPKITSWAESHALTSYLKASLITPTASEIFDASGWISPIINTEQGSMIAGGELQGLRFVAVGFELLPYEGKNTPTLSVLTFNIFNWLMGQTLANSITLTGETFEKAGPFFYQDRKSSRKEVRVVNAFHTEESQTFTATPLKLVSNSAPSLSHSSPSPLWRYLLLIALSVLLLEFFLRVRTTLVNR